MTTSLVVQELVIVIAAKNLNPIVLTPEFLKYSSIVPAEWELARQPMCTQQGSQVTFTNGISIVAQPQRVMFAEAIDGKVAAEVAIPSIARKYVQTLPNLDYQAIGLNPRGYITFDSEPGAAHKYISEKLLSAGEWQEVGTAPVRATINLAYTLERGVFNLSVNEAALRQPDETITPLVLFSGNFSYDIAGKNGEEKLTSLYQAIENWQADVDSYKNIINTKFLASKAEPKVMVPDLFAMSASA
jgi:hypothetical protein